MDTISLPPPIQPICLGGYEQQIARCDMLRLDTLHPVVSGNKWFKLRLNIEDALTQNADAIVTVGGGYSNHLVAAAYAAKEAGLKSVGMVKGVYLHPTPTMRQCKAYGMELIQVPKTLLQQALSQWATLIDKSLKNPYFIPEGGDNKYGIKGCEAIANYIDKSYTHIALPVGTGTTMAGITRACSAEQFVIGYAPMKEGKYLLTDIKDKLPKVKHEMMTIVDDWHFGGFGQCNDDLIAFMNHFYTQNQIPLDRVYTAKMMYGIAEQLQSGYFLPHTRLLCVHTGGLQGNASLKNLLIY
ncbi:MAG: pyridoxal-phosphate dependent enzyme [Chitinophagia bacterium]|nr:pyridoxal-phosphate dependent enzyme [Chitinophagia bacterium]